MGETAQSSASGYTTDAPQKASPASSNTAPSHGENKRVLLIVLCVAVTLLLLVSYVQKQQNNTYVQTPSVTKTALFLSLTSPTEDAVIDNNKVKVVGKTLPHTPVVLYTEGDQNSVESDSAGNFEGEIGLSGGINTLTVEAYGENGEEKSVVMDIVYDDQSLSSL